MKIDLHLEITDDNGTHQSVALGAMDIEASLVSKALCI